MIVQPCVIVSPCRLKMVTLINNYLVLLLITITNNYLMILLSEDPPEEHAINLHICTFLGILLLVTGYCYY